LHHRIHQDVRLSCGAEPDQGLGRVLALSRWLEAIVHARGPEITILNRHPVCGPRTNVGSPIQIEGAAIDGDMAHPPLGAIGPNKVSIAKILIPGRGDTYGPFLGHPKPFSIGCAQELGVLDQHIPSRRAFIPKPNARTHQNRSGGRAVHRTIADRGVPMEHKATRKIPENGHMGDLKVEKE